MDVVVIGSCMTDLIAYTHKLPKVGETVHGYKFTIGFGGKGANQCMAASKLGASVALIAKLGNDNFGKDYFSYLKRNNIDVNFTKIINGSSGIAQISVGDNGDNQIILAAGTNNELHYDDVKEADSLISKCKVVIFQFETPLQTTLQTLELCVNYPCITIVNAAPGVANIDFRILQLCDIFCVNESEAEIITKVNVSSIDNAKMSVVKLFEMGCKLPIITLGAKGVVFFSNEFLEPIHFPVEEVKPVDTTGAGDAFIGGMAYFFAKLEHLSISEIIRRSCEVAKYSVQRFGTQSSFPYFKDLPSTLFE